MIVIPFSFCLYTIVAHVYHFKFDLCKLSFISDKNSLQVNDNTLALVCVNGILYCVSLQMWNMRHNCSVKTHA